MDKKTDEIISKLSVEEKVSLVNCSKGCFSVNGMDRPKSLYTITRYIRNG